MRQAYRLAITIFVVALLAFPVGYHMLRQQGAALLTTFETTQTTMQEIGHTSKSVRKTITILQADCLQKTKELPQLIHSLHILFRALTYLTVVYIIANCISISLGRAY